MSLQSDLLLTKKKEKPFQALLAAEPFNIQTQGSFLASYT